MVRNWFFPVESQGSITSVWPTFSIRTARFDCQLCSIAPSRFIPQPIGDRQFVPSIVPPCTTVYLWSPVTMSSTCLLATSPGRAFEAQGSSAVSEPETVNRATDKIALNMVVSPQDDGTSSAAHCDPFVPERQELPRGTRVALLDGGQDAGCFAHVGQFTPRRPTRLAWWELAAERASWRKIWQADENRHWRSPLSVPLLFSVIP